MARMVVIVTLALAVTALMLSSIGAGSPRSVTAGLATAAATGVGTTAPTSESAREQAILAELRGSHVPTSMIHLPDLSASRPYAGETVGPTYSSAPAPMGVADLGLQNVSGQLRGTILDTSSVEGQITLTNALSANVDGDGPNMYGIQLNAVVTGITLFGNSSYQFWTQNFVSYVPSTGQLFFGDNVWNFSNYAAYISPNVFYATGPNGTLYAPVYYYAYGPTFTIHYPFTLTFYENSTVLFDRPAVFFNYTVANSTMRVSGSYDYVVFNATVGTPRHPYRAGVYQINGKQIDPVGLPNDLELDVLGNDDGDTTSFYAIDATASIATWDATSREYVTVPSAMDAGAETGETSDGISVSYSGSSPVAHLQLGPSFIYGLWGMSSDAGARKVVQALDPASTFLLVNPGSTRNDSAAQWVPPSPDGSTTFYVPNGGSYWIEYLLSERSPGHVVLRARDNSTTHLTWTGPMDPGLGVYTPLIAFGNAQLASLSSSGSGTLASPYVLYNNEPGPIDPEFAQWNDFQFPVFPGILLVGTTDYVTVTPPSLTYSYPSWMLSEIEQYGLPSTNNLQVQFWNTTHVRVLGGTISGWLSAFVTVGPEGSLMFWNASHNLVDGVTFLDQGDAIAAYGGTANTFWGNRFLPTTVDALDPSDVLNYGAYTQAIYESESGDLIYNNYVAVPFPALTPNYDPLSCQFLCNAAVYLDRWNVNREPASEVRVIDGIALSGDILGLSWQGGNYWSNYGSASDPYGVLPYNNSGQIIVGGDHQPLAPPLYRVVFSEHGLRAGREWSVTLNGITLESTSSSITFWDPNGTYAFDVPNVHAHQPDPPYGWVTVSGAGVRQSIQFT